jgi:CheY-like chemotaxis protein
VARLWSSIDEELVRLSTSNMLADLGYWVVEAGSAEEALRMLNRGASLDLVDTDHLMPGMNGSEVARTIRPEANSGSAGVRTVTIQKPI